MKSSPSVNKIIPALIKAQKEIKAVIKEGINPHFKSHFAEFDDILEECKKVLNANELFLCQPTYVTPDGTVLETVVMHESGEWICSESYVINKAGTDQGYGSSLSYQKRYGLRGLLGVATLDDDGHAASQEPKPLKIVSSGRISQITEPQRKRLFAIANKHGWDEKRIKKFMKVRFNIESTKDLTKLNYEHLISTIERSEPEGDKDGGNSS